MHHEGGGGPVHTMSSQDEQILAIIGRNSPVIRGIRGGANSLQANQSSPANASDDADVIVVPRPDPLESSSKRVRRGPAPLAPPAPPAPLAPSAPSASAKRDCAYDNYLAEERMKVIEEREKIVLEKEKIQLEKQFLMLQIKKIQMEIKEKQQYVDEFEI